MAKKQYYDIKNLLSTKAQYLMLLGQRANGKSYQVKKTVLEDAYNNNKWFVYLRRYKADIKQNSVESYFLDMPIDKITDNEYTGVCAWNGELFFTRYDEEKQATIKGLKIGRYCALNEYERYKSNVFMDYNNIVYEEFITDNIYLTDEPKLLQQFVSTVARHNELRVFLIGNTLSRVCPYFSEWCLEGVLKQKIGTIEVYHFHVGSGENESVINIAVEYCANANYDNKMFFGQTSKQIISGEWDTTDVSKLPRPQEDYELVYEVEVEYQKFVFIMRLLVEPINGGMLVFIYPKSEKSKRKLLRRITQNFSDNPFETARLDTGRIAESYILKCFQEGKVCYSDNLTGSDFKKVNEHMRIGYLV